MSAKYYRIWICLIIFLSFQIKSVFAQPDSDSIAPLRVLYNSDRADMIIDTNLTYFVIFEATLRISIESLINQSIWIEFSHYIYGGIELFVSDLQNLSIGVNNFEFKIPAKFFNLIGVFSFDLFISREDADSGKELIYYNAYAIQVVLNPFLVINIGFIFIIFLGFILIRKEPLLIFPRLITRISESGQNLNDNQKLNEKIRPIPCPSCNHKIPEGSAYCSYCGYHLALFERRLF